MRLFQIANGVRKLQKLQKNSRLNNKHAPVTRADNQTMNNSFYIIIAILFIGCSHTNKVLHPSRELDYSDLRISSSQVPNSILLKAKLIAMVDLINLAIKTGALNDSYKAIILYLPNESPLDISCDSFRLPIKSRFNKIILNTGQYLYTNGLKSFIVRPDSSRVVGSDCFIVVSYCLLGGTEVSFKYQVKYDGSQFHIVSRKFTSAS